MGMCLQFKLIIKKIRQSCRFDIQLPHYAAPLTISALLLSNATHAQAPIYDDAPEIELPNIFNQELIKLSDYRGKVVLVDFWASWCGPCVASLPEYNELRNRLIEKHSSDVFEVLAINVDATTEEALEFLKDYKLDFQILEERTGKSQHAYDLLVMPTSVLIDQKGKVRVAHQGFSKGYILYLEQEIDKLLLSAKGDSSSPKKTITSPKKQ